MAVFNTPGSAGVIVSYDLDTGKTLLERRLPRAVNCVAFSIDRRRGLVGAYFEDLDLIDLTTMETVRRLPVRPDEAAFLADGRRALLAVGRNLELWDLAAASVVRRWEVPWNNISGLGKFAMSPDGWRAFTSNSDDRAIRAWDVETGRELWHADRSGSSLVVSADGRYLLASNNVMSRNTYAGEDGFLRLLEAATGRELARWGGLNTIAFSFSPDARRALSGGLNNAVYLWDVAKGAVLENWQLTATVYNVAFSSDGRLALAATGDGLRVWRVRE